MLAKFNNVDSTVNMDIDTDYEIIDLDCDKLGTILEDILKDEGIDKLNMTVQELGRLDGTRITHIVPVIEYAGVSDSNSVIKLSENIKSFAVFGNVCDEHDLGVAVINSNMDYLIHPDIEDYFDFEQYGCDMDTEWNGEYLDGNIYVGLKDFNTLEYILEDDDIDEDEEMSMQGM